MAHAVHVKKAQKDYPEHGIKKGESYYWWKFKRGGKYYSKTAPRRSQLTQSAFYAAIFDIEDEIADAPADDGLAGIADDIASRLRELGDECQSNLDNMPEGLQQGSSGELLQERVSAMEQAADEIESLEFDEPNGDDFDLPEQEEGESDEKYAERREEAIEHETQAYWESKLEELQAVSIEAP